MKVSPHLTLAMWRQNIESRRRKITCYWRLALWRPCV
jgi:hypothetical protein